MQHSRAKSGEHGAILVEMAFALPLLALVFLSIIDLGLIVREYQVLQNAAREGARYSSLEYNRMIPSNQAVIQAAIEDFVIAYAAQEKITIERSKIKIEQAYPIPGGCGTEVIVSYDRQMLLLGIPILPRGTVTLTGRSVFYNLFGC